MCPPWPPLLLLGGFVLSGAALVSGIEIYAPSAVEAVNGTAVKLKCTFRSTHPVSSQSVIVSWNFRALNSKTEESVFYYQEVAYPPKSGRFKGHAVWSGDVTRKDASITLREVPPTFNGTYICNVRNRPDVHGDNRETTLSVVTEASLSEISILVIAVVTGCALILIVLALFLAVKFYMRRRGGEDVEMRAQEPVRKDPTVCKPEEAVHLTVVKETHQVSSDDEASEPSSGDDDEEDDSEEEDDDDDDYDDGDDDDD
ncbi:myelin protein zero-like protein 2b [Phycodurus eques]|uniref:myelin protein zero-like protein 2b n=1 Tax=Phycodurus eques TaxID=693459 RepID=UPI002ACE9B63|nr:myelin protein zero-like protein 2b [Phycodurus eques]XP_061559262.1 myelin protein zero-like protein 2b [Phycodurus eques]